MKSDREKLKEFLNNKENNKKYVSWLIHYSKPYIPRIVLLMLISMAGTFFSIELAVISKKILDNAAKGGAIFSVIGLYILVLAASQILTIVSRLVSTMLNERFSFGIRKQVYDKILNSVWKDVSKYHTGDLMTRMTSDAGYIADGIVNVIPQIMVLLFELVAVFITLFMYSKFLAIFALAMAPFAALVALVLGRKLKPLQVKVQESETNYRSFIQESLSHLLVVKAFDNETFFSKKLVQLREERFHWVWKRTLLSTGTSAAMSVLFELGYVIAFSYGVLQIASGEITFGTLTVFLQLVNRVSAPVLEIASKLPSIVSIIASAGRVMEIQNMTPDERLGIKEVPAVNVGVKVSDVSFGYSNDTVLNGISFNLNPGDFVALVGESGIGKTTLINLLNAFFLPGSGSIEYYDSKGNVIPLNADVRKFISYVPQGNSLFSGTIRSNILHGKPDATEEEIAEAVRLSSVGMFIDDLKDGLDTKLGEKGTGISEGQAQRVAIARALIRKSPFLILDEATSALDEKTELAVLGGLSQLNPRPTCLMITHRRSVLKYCNRELRIVDGVLTEIDMDNDPLQRDVFI
ncbi:ABC transporter ATP-binding protein [Butyrivibrio sp. MC2013]|uniref:ABC transporter ATP-binding protein n=1 Tax=Butyrivibrio sp. MC2013 TaxID=1280686 RepID=UPI0003F7E5B4|nr:ABC transporter ATP-binding protein [Butyrivibrio sp. MC2013]